MKKAAIYLRSASTRGQDVNLSSQRASAEAFADMHGWAEPDVFTDAGVSANRLDRPGLTAMLAAARSGDIDVLVVEDIQRLARKPELLAEILLAMSETDVEVAVMSGPVHGPDAASLVRAGLLSNFGKQTPALGSGSPGASYKARRVRK